MKCNLCNNNVKIVNIVDNFEICEDCKSKTKRSCQKCSKIFFTTENKEICFSCEQTIKYTKKLHWLSRHSLTNGQKATIFQYFGNIETEQQNVLFNNNIVEQIDQIVNPKRIGEKIVALVAPLSYGLMLLRNGYTIIEFVNVPSARQKGLFLCKGMNIHTLDKTRFIPCPLSEEEQEQGDLSYNSR